MFLLVLVLSTIGTTKTGAQDSFEDLIKSIWADEFPSSAGGCYCVPYYLCLDNGTVNNAGIGVIDVRIDDKEDDCENIMDICCEKDTITQKAQDEYPARDKGCGYSNPDGISFSSGPLAPDVTKFGEVPWMVGLLTSDKDNPDDGLHYECGGALIHPAVVLTAAHCIPDLEKKTLKIRAGEWDSRGLGHALPHQDSFIANTVVHPEFFRGALFNDIALLFLETTLTITGNVDVICLPPQDFNFDDKRCLATGWGKDDYGENSDFQSILKKVDLPVVPRATCQESFKKTRLGRDFQLHESFICAGGEVGKDTCKGDGGSPLTCPMEGHTDRYYQAGIVAWGIGCNDAVPAAYVDVAHFRNWIDEELAKKDIKIENI